MQQLDYTNPNHIFVFGSNTEGRHGKGAARFAVKYMGAIYGQAEGLQGRSYAIITKNLQKGKRSVSLYEIRIGLAILAKFATTRPDLTFFLTAIGTGYAGYTVSEIRVQVDMLQWPVNVIIPPIDQWKYELP